MENKEIKDELKRQTNDAYSYYHSAIKLDKALKNERNVKDMLMLGHDHDQNRIRKLDNDLKEERKVREGFSFELADAQRKIQKQQNVIDMYESLVMDI